MAVGTHNVATLDLSFQAANGQTLRSQPADIPSLLSEVIELEDDDVRLAALHTWVRCQVLDEKGFGLFLTACFRPPCLIAVQLASLTEVLAKAIATPPLVAGGGMAVEARERQLEPTLAARPRRL